MRQCFAPPVPEWPVGGVQLLEALRKWTRAEADAVRFTKVPDEATAAVYALRLELWGLELLRRDSEQDCGRDIPYVTAALREVARAVSNNTEERLVLAVALYRREYNKSGGGIFFKWDLEERMASTGESRNAASLALKHERDAKRKAERDAELEAKREAKREVKRRKRERKLQRRRDRERARGI